MNIQIESLRLGEKVPVPPEPGTEREIMAGWTGEPTEPLVSIVCHSYNHAGFVKDALNGFLMQRTDFPFEIVVHDDASDDGTAKIIEDYAERFPRILRPILQKENQFSQGRRPAWFSFPAAKGKYIAICEGDDYWLDEDKIARQASFLERNPAFSVCGHDAIIVKDGLLSAHSKLLHEQRRDYDANALQKGGYVLSATAMFANKIAEYAPEQSHILNGDNLMFSRLGEFGGAKYMDDVGPAAYRVHGGGVWSSLGERHKIAARINTLFWISKYYDRTGDVGMSRYYSHQAIECVLSDAATIGMRDFFGIVFRFLGVYASRKFPAAFQGLRKLTRK